MAHFAEVDGDKMVIRVLVIPDEQEHRGQDFLADDLGLGGRWLQTSYNNRIRKNYAGIGYTYDETRDAFIPPKPYDSWVLNEDACQWEPSVPCPTTGIWHWDEASLSWLEVTNA